MATSQERGQPCPHGYRRKLWTRADKAVRAPFAAFVKPARGIVLGCFLLTQRGIAASAQSLPQFDFTKSEIAREWRNPHHISALRPTADGLEITINGDDPYFFGPTRNYPTGTPLLLFVRLKSEQGGVGEVFYYRDHPEPRNAVKFSVPEGAWTEARIPLPPLGANYRIRLDPPGTGGKVLLASMRFEKRITLPPPTWPAWKSPGPVTERVLASGSLELFAGNETPFGIELRVRGESVAFGHPRPRIGYVQDEQVRWLDLSTASVRADKDGATIKSLSRDVDGAEWSYEQTFRTHSAGVVEMKTTVSVNQDRAVVFLPMQMLIAGEKSFGTNKTQGLFAGLEYLDDEPSSSEADIIGPESNRRLPASHKLTFPLMAIQANNRYVGLIWEQPTKFSALFDSPDRTFGSGGHLMGVVFPDAQNTTRDEGSLLPYSGHLLKAKQPVVSHAFIIGGSGNSVVPAVQEYVRLRGLPELPDTELNFSDYVALASQGWLTSKCRETNFYRHAVWAGFNAHPAADAALFETWLAAHTTDAVQRDALGAAASGALSLIKPHSYYHSAIGHVRTPATPLVFGAVHEAVEAARQSAGAQLGRFAADGSVPYRASSKGMDYGKTHFAPDANGLTAQVVATLLEAAAFAGDRELIGQGIVKLRALDKFRNTVPRGAQTWEVPLHTPDILASAHLVRAYTLGYQLTGEKEFLDQATYWAWTGVPFIYLVNPTGQRVGPYSTVPVLGATSWKDPIWFGRPVQWCGMVYADALYRLAPHDATGPWKQLADGITSAGLQHTWRSDDRDRVGLLPDFYELRPQTRAGPAINPATVGMGAVRLYGQGPIYDFLAFRRSGLLVHAPGEIVSERESERSVSFTVRAWPTQPYQVLVNGFAKTPTVKVNGTNALQEFHETELILKLAGQSRVDIDLDTR